MSKEVNSQAGFVQIALRVPPTLRDDLASAAASETIKRGGVKVSVNTLVTEILESWLTERASKKSKA